MLLCRVKEKNPDIFQSQDNLENTAGTDVTYFILRSIEWCVIHHYIFSFSSPPLVFHCIENYPDIHPATSTLPTAVTVLVGPIKYRDFFFTCPKPASVVCCICREIIPRCPSTAWVLLLPLLLLCRAITA